MEINRISLATDLSVSYVGAPKSSGKLPALFYFALSAEDSLQKDPYNQPVEMLKKEPVRIFSLTLPAHENKLPPEKALAAWAKSMAAGVDPLSPFFAKARRVLKLLIEQGWIKENKIAVAGLSRGAFVACHFAALCPEVGTILGFAPLTELSAVKDFIAISENSLVQNLNLSLLLEKLYNRALRFYIGNLDVRVGTDRCFSFVHSLAKCALENHIRSSPIELIVGPSVGFQGHGTPPHRFQEGIDYLKKVLL